MGEHRRQVQLLAGTNLLVSDLPVFNRDISVLNSRQILRAQKSHWPRNFLGRCWPNSPTVAEFGAWASSGNHSWVGRPLTTTFTYRQAWENPKVLVYLVSKMVLGIRSSVSVPEKFRGYFRYRWGVLLLIDATYIPVGLARFLASVWVRHPKLIWSVSAGNFRSNLKCLEFDSSLLK